jgi:hypothetical protein
MTGEPIAASPLGWDGLGRLTSQFGQSRLAEPPLPARAEAAAVMERDGGAKATRVVAAAATRP